jgi:tetratricopeptide (TPR) repeat protein
LTSRACIRAIFDWDWHSAAQEFETAISLNPAYAQARQWFAMNCLAPRGRFGRAREELMVAAELEPVSLPIATSLGALDFIEGNHAAAIQRFRTVLELDEGFYLAYYFMGQAYTEMRMYAEAIRELERAVALTHGSSESLAALACAQAAAGQRAESCQLLRELSERSAARYVSPVLIAQVHMGLQQYDEAIANLEEAFRVRSSDLIWLGVRPAFEKIRSHDRVVKIMVEAGLKMQPKTPA